MDLLATTPIAVEGVSLVILFAALGIPFVIGVVLIWLMMPRPHFPDQED